MNNSNKPTRYQLNETVPASFKLTTQEIWNTFKGFMLSADTADNLTKHFKEGDITLKQLDKLGYKLFKHYEELEDLIGESDFAYEELEELIGVEQSVLFTKFAHCLGLTQPETI